MIPKLLTYDYWFKLPPIFFTVGDKILFWGFVVLFALGIVLWILAKYQEHKVNLKLVRKLNSFSFWIGFSGLVWALLRYENTPVFALRMWAGIVLVCGIIWFLFILKYLLMNYFKEKKEYDYLQIKNKYIPGNR